MHVHGIVICIVFCAIIIVAIMYGVIYGADLTKSDAERQAEDDLQAKIVSSYSARRKRDALKK